MRKSAKKGKLSVHATAGTNAVFLGFDLENKANEKWPEGLMGFVVDRTDHDNDDEVRPLRGRLTFRATAHTQYSLDDYCIQEFQFGDYSAKPGHTYTYEVAPLYGEPTKLKRGPSVSVKIQTEDPADDVNGIWFNRGTAAIDYFNWNYRELPQDELDRAINKGVFLNWPQSKDKPRRLPEEPAEAVKKREKDLKKLDADIQTHAATIDKLLKQIQAINKSLAARGDKKLSATEKRHKKEELAEKQLELRKTKRKSREAQKSIEKKQREPMANEAAQWLSRGLGEALIAFLKQANDKDWTIRGCLYELTYRPILDCLLEAIEKEVDVQLVVDDRSSAGQNYGILKEKKAYRKLREDHILPRDIGGISHNKFFVLLYKGKTVSVWTGSTNLTPGGIFGHSNVGHAVRDAKVAETYLEYWTEIDKDPTTSAFRKFNGQHTKVPPEDGKIQVIFSPRGSGTNLDSLNFYRDEMKKTTSATFLTAAFGVSTELADVLKDPNEKFLRYVLMDNKGQQGSLDNYYDIENDPNTFIALGDTIDEGELWGWYAEQLTGLNKHVPYIHTKYMLIDPLSDDPTIFTGSANFSKASTVSNDENMLVLRGNKRVADIYLTEFMRMFQHFQFRNRLDASKSRDMIFSDVQLPRQVFLVPNDSWVKKFYKRYSAEEKERLYFAGKSRKKK